MTAGTLAKVARRLNRRHRRRHGARLPPLLMLTGKMKVKGLMKMGTFGKLFPEPKPDQIITV